MLYPDYSFPYLHFPQHLLTSPLTQSHPISISHQKTNRLLWYNIKIKYDEM